MIGTDHGDIDRRWLVTIVLKAGEPFEFLCDELNVETTPDQRISSLEWVNADQGIRYLHFDNIAAILQRDRFNASDDSAEERQVGGQG